MQIKDLEFSDKCLIDRKCPLHCQLHDKQVSKRHLLARDGFISDSFNCCTSYFRLTALNVWDVPQEVVKSEQKCADFEIDLKDFY